jgi:hypothetical protein
MVIFFFLLILGETLIFFGIFFFLTKDLSISLIKEHEHKVFTTQSIKSIAETNALVNV